jgi:putative two-component system hydrogenase maturation factor HypX/HoxX
VTVLQAAQEMDAGEVWAWEPFAVRAGATKSSLYRREVTQAAVLAVLRALQRFTPASLQPQPGLDSTAKITSGTWNPLVSQTERRIDWTRDSTATVLSKIAAADGSPGVLDSLFDAHPASAQVAAAFSAHEPGSVLARRGPALLRRTVDGAIWIGHVRLGAWATERSAQVKEEPAQSPATNVLKLAATRVFAAQSATLPELPAPLMREDDGNGEWDELRYREFGPVNARVGWLDFEFHNGAMSERQCQRLTDALRWVRTRSTQVLVLAGGQEFFSNGIHLHDIEAAQRVAGDSAADASMRNINAMDDVALEVLTFTDRITIAALHGNAGAGGCFLALAADVVWAQAGVVLNPHYKNMGNLYGSEYWTYSLPRRIGEAASRALVQERLPLTAADAVARGLLDASFGESAQDFGEQVLERALALAATHNLPQRLTQKQAQREHDEAHKPLADYRAEELQRMHRNFYGFDPSYHVARHHFVYRKPHAWTPRHLAVHR